jgi:hypothetical protein
VENLTDVQEVSQGSFGCVYSATMRTEPGAPAVRVALKASRDGVDPSVFGNEVSQYMLLHANPHDNVLPVHGLCEDHPDGRPRLVTAWAPFGSLESILLSDERVREGQRWPRLPDNLLLESR